MFQTTIHDIKSFMGDLLSKERFDTFELVEVTVKMDITYHIDGHKNKDFYDTDEEELRTASFTTWQEVRPHIFTIIKGRRLPLAMKLVLKAPDSFLAKLCSNTNDSVRPADFEGLYLNIIYDQTALRVTTGVSYRTFILDKTIEQAYDRHMEKHLERYRQI